MNKNLSIITELLPHGESGKIDFEALALTPLGKFFEEMKKTPQDVRYHAEGNVFLHTVAVTEAIIREKEYLAADKKDKLVLFLSAILHDIGKIKTTVTSGGEISSPKHSIVGEHMARELLWREFGLAGDDVARDLRESVCALVRYHSFPPHAIQEKRPEYKILRIASLGELAPSFSMRKLYLLEKADILGRISEDNKLYLEGNEYFRMLAEELSVLDSPYKFKDAYSERAYFRNKTEWRDQQMWRESFGEVILMSGLPGTGKDFYINKHYPDMPVISLDDIRAELKISPTDNQGRVVLEATERARALLRKKTPFVFNATNLSAEIRAKNISLFEDYGASVKTIFLETSFDEGLRRNAERERYVPEAVIEKMLTRLEIPKRHECESVVWQTI